MNLDLRSAILRTLADEPLDKVALSKKLNLPPAKRNELRDLLRDLEREGRIATIRNGQFCIPKEADLVTGSMLFLTSGAAKLINTADGQPELFITAENTSTAMHGDRVVARIIVERGRPAPGSGGKQEGRVIRVLERASETIVGTLQKSPSFHYVVGDDPRFVHHIYVPAPTPPLNAKLGDKVVVRLLEWKSRHLNPEGVITEVLGAAGAPGVDMLSIIRKHRLPLVFPNDVIHEAEDIPPEIPQKELSRREDLRRKFIFTIDPDDARDFDDAIHVEESAKGWTVGIHIADVSHYVRPKTLLDREAYSRGNSVYLADRVIPMLPEALSNGICSLRPDEDRLTFSVFVELNRVGKFVSARFAKTVIRSVKRLTYKQAFAILRQPPTDDLGQRVHTAWKLASILRKRRFENGSLDLDFPEIKVWLDETGKPTRLEKIDNDISHQLIEEFMLLANECVARELKHARQPTVYRVHEKPDPERLNEYRELILVHGFQAGDLGHRAELQRILASFKGTGEEYALKIGLLKSLKRAKYHPDPLGHYGLNKIDYTHFTSPIRRYADLVVHRSLERRLGLTKLSPQPGEISAIAEHISVTERIAADAEKESVRMKKLEYFQIQVNARKGEVFKAIITEVRNFGFFVELPDYLLSGLVHISVMDDDFYLHDAPKARFVGRRTRRTFRAGDPIDVIVCRVDVFKQQVDFRPAPIESKDSPKGQPPNRRPDRKSSRSSRRKG